MASLQTIRESRNENAILEAFRASSQDKIMSLILSYLTRRLGNLVQMPGVEHFFNSHGEGYGLRYFTSKGRSFRFNWKGSDAGSVKSIVSVNVWDGSSHDPTIEINTAGLSLTKILPSLADLILKPQVGDINIVVESNYTPDDQSLCEARTGANAEEVLDELLEFFAEGHPFSEHKISSMGRTTALSLWRRILKVHPDFFSVERTGTKTFYQLNAGLSPENFNKEEILGTKITLATEVGANGERYTSEEIRKLEGEARKVNAIPYEEQLEDLNKLVKAVSRGASNALFVGGSGGGGKTYQVEKALSELGLEDGSGYFKNTTSASAAGMYKTLYNYRDSIVLFDDCDTVFKDQESRNLLKAATDTKHNRKLSWGKSAFWIYKGDPADLEARKDRDDDSIFDDDSGSDEDQKYPRYFTFSGRVIFISNLQMDQLDPDGALRTRGFIIMINPTPDEMINFMEKILDKIALEDGMSLSSDMRKKVFDVVKNGSGAGDMNMRKLVRGMNMAATGTPGWEILVSRYA